MFSPQIPQWEVPLAEENHSPSHEGPRKALKQALRQSRALTLSLLGGDSVPAPADRQDISPWAHPTAMGSQTYLGGYQSPGDSGNPCVTGFPMSPLNEGDCRTQESPEGLTQPQKWRKGNCRLSPKGGKARTPSWACRAAGTWLDSGQGVVLCSGKPLCQVTLGADTHLGCAFNISFHNKAAETSLTRTLLSQHSPALPRKAPELFLSSSVGKPSPG